MMSCVLKSYSRRSTESEAFYLPLQVRKSEVNNFKRAFSMETFIHSFVYEQLTAIKELFHKDFIVNLKMQYSETLNIDIYY